LEIARTFLLGTVPRGEHNRIEKQEKEDTMLRTFVCAVLTLSFVTGLSLAADTEKGKDRTTRGTIKKIDAKEGILTVTVKSKKTEPTDKEFKLSSDTKIVVLSGTEKKEFIGKEGLNNDALKEGAAVTVVTAKKDLAKVKEIRLGGTKKKKKPQ
jgi:hypothetical protein